MDHTTSSTIQNIAVIISTTGRKTLLELAIPSVLSQSRKPDILYVIADSADLLPDRDIFPLNTANFPVKLILNARDKNLSGAMNTALSEMLDDGLDPEKTFISVLDDDDWWESDYLESCYNAALNGDSDWVISGIVRHEAQHDIGKKLSVQDNLTERMFYIGNPHVQGSNLFVRFSKVLLAGGYDENLPSTTDRDLCLRLLALGNIRITTVKRHMVHHLAIESGRLSDKGSRKKCIGLERFYYKYGPLMTKDERKRFHQRAREYFGCNVKPVSEKASGFEPTELPSNIHKKNINLVIGVILSDHACFKTIVSDVVALNIRTGSVSALVVSDNCELPRNIIDETSNEMTRAGIKLTVVSSGEAWRSAEIGDLGHYYLDEGNRKGIAFGRTVLHRYVYLECLKYPDPVAWIIDDDVSVKNIYWGTFNTKIDEKEFLAHIERWKEEGVSIAVGKVGGDPPVPVMSTARTQMLDLYYNFNALLNGSPVPSVEREWIARRDITKTLPGFFYDFSEESNRHLETPVWKYLQYTSLTKLSDNAGQILRKAVFRPASYPQIGKGFGDRYYYPESEDFGPVRGGNTLVFDIDCLRDFTNSSPRSENIPYRRGDTLWVILNRRLGARRPIKPARKIVSTPLMIVQDRRKNETVEEMREKLVSDTLGSAFSRSIDSFLFEEMRRIKVRDDYYDPLRFTDSDIAYILDTMEKLIYNRMRQMSLNAWRIRGLIQSIRSVFVQADALARFEGKDAEVNGIVELCERIESLFSESGINNIIHQVKNFKREAVTNFLVSLSLSCRQFSDALPIRYSEEDKNELKSIVRKTFGSGDLHFIGNGKEGFVLSDGFHAYKFFHYGMYAMDSHSLAFLNDRLLGKKYNSIAGLYSISVADRNLIFKEEYVEGRMYHGGMLSEFISLLRDCRSNGIVIKNIAPKNIVDNGKELKFVDLGRDIEPYTEAGFIKMCRRVYLTLRWYFRQDIHELLHRSKDESCFPELFGFRYFIDLVEKRHTGEISVPFTTMELSEIRHKKILDYGCGNGQIADNIAKNNEVSVYDTNMSDFYKKHSKGNACKVMSRESLNRVSRNRDRFDVILLSLVLCTIDDAKTREILSDCRRVVSDTGEIAIVICNPFNVNNIETSTHRKMGCPGNYHSHFEFEKKMKASGKVRKEYHRPLDWYVRELKNAGFMPYEFSESEGASLDHLSPGSEFLMIRAYAIRTITGYDVSLIIKASPMEWRTIGYQVRHIVAQLEGPEKFREKFIVTDKASGNFTRQYDSPDLAAFDRELTKLLDEGVVDSVIYASEENSVKENISERWFGLKCAETRSINGQPVLTTLEGFDHTRSRYILQVDSDCIIYRDSSKKSYLEEMMNVLISNESAVTVSFPICNIEKRTYTPFNESEGKWRTEVRFCMIDMKRLNSLKPLPNRLDHGRLELPWHRTLDLKLASGTGNSYRGSTGNACFIHVPNQIKSDKNFWYNAVKYHEKSQPSTRQMSHVDLQATDIQDLLEERNDDMIVIIKGRDVPIPKVRRCFRSLLEQDFQEFGVIYIDAASGNGSDEYVQYIGKNLFSGKITFFRNITPLTSIENIFIAIRKICKNPQSIIVMLDADDALIGKDALSKVKHKYENGADMTVGTMIRTDKYKEYPVNFDSPRHNRGGNVWQHLRTFRKYLFDWISQEDLKINGEWISEADDWAYMIPMVEMAKNPVIIRDIVYFYEPSPEKVTRDINSYEDTIGKIVAKGSYKREKAA